MPFQSILKSEAIGKISNTDPVFILKSDILFIIDFLYKTFI